MRNRNMPRRHVFVGGANETWPCLFPEARFHKRTMYLCSKTWGAQTKHGPFCFRRHVFTNEPCIYVIRFRGTFSFTGLVFSTEGSTRRIAQTMANNVGACMAQEGVYCGDWLYKCLSSDRDPGGAESCWGNQAPGAVPSDSDRRAAESSLGNDASWAVPSESDPGAPESCFGNQASQADIIEAMFGAFSGFQGPQTGLAFGPLENLTLNLLSQAASAQEMAAANEQTPRFLGDSQQINLAQTPVFWADSEPVPIQIKKTEIKKVCSKCGKLGHNMRTCELEEEEAVGKRQRRDRGPSTPKEKNFSTDPLSSNSIHGATVRAQLKGVFFSPERRARKLALFDDGPLQHRMREILNDRAIAYIGTLLKKEMLEILPNKSLFGFRSILIDKELYLARFHTRYCPKEKDKSKSTSRKVIEFSRDDVEEMLGACGYFREHSTRLNADDLFIEYKYDPLFAIQRQYRFCSILEGEDRSGFVKHKCPQVLAEVISRLRAQIALEETWFKTVWQERANIKFLSVPEIMSRIETPQVFFFPLEKLRYNEHEINNLFTLFEETEEKELREHQTSQKGMTMSKAFKRRMPMYYKWIVDEGISSVQT